MDTRCHHDHLQCLNEYELIRKYKCNSCGAVMMCDCDEPIGRRFLSHQLSNGTELTTGKRVPVTTGFQPQICRECRGLPAEPHPVAEIHGRTSKIKRYYWRELHFREMELIAEWEDNQQGNKPSESDSFAAAQAAEQQALAEIKAFHATQPKYTFTEESQHEVLTRYSVKIIDLDATYLPAVEGERARILDSGDRVSADDFVQRHFERTGYSVIVLESRPFHVLFGVFMWMVVQDPDDAQVGIRGFGERLAFQENRPSEMIWTHLPDDFGKEGYFSRRREVIEGHFASIMKHSTDLTWLFEYWLEPSEKLRQYLWAHSVEDVAIASQLVEVMPPDSLFKILRYLVEDYWGRYLGWPDLLVYRNSEFTLVEVKGSGDKLSEDQKNWIRGNHEILKFPFTLAKIHKKSISSL